MLCLRFAQGSFAVVDDGKLMASLSEGPKDMPCKANFVFDNQNLHEFMVSTAPPSANAGDVTVASR